MEISLRPATAIDERPRFIGPSTLAGFAPHLDGRRVLDWHGRPLFVLDEKLRILFRNDAARRVLKTNRGLAERAGRLLLGAPPAEEAWRRLIGENRSAHAEPRITRGLRVARPGSARDWLLLIRPLGPEHGEERAVRSFFVQIIDRTRPRRMPIRALQDLFCVSDREVAVILEILRARSLRKAAARLRITHETIRSHLKRIFRKCDVHSQEELVSLLHCVAEFGWEPRHE